MAAVAVLVAVSVESVPEPAAAPVEKLAAARHPVLEPLSSFLAAVAVSVAVPVESVPDLISAVSPAAPAAAAVVVVRLVELQLVCGSLGFLVPFVAGGGSFGVAVAAAVVGLVGFAYVELVGELFALVVVGFVAAVAVFPEPFSGFF